MDAARGAFSDGARMLLAGADDAVGQHGALADYLDVRVAATSAPSKPCLGDLLEHVVVDSHAQAHAGFALVRGQGAGRCGFIVIGDARATSRRRRCTSRCRGRASRCRASCGSPGRSRRRCARSSATRSSPTRSTTRRSLAAAPAAGGDRSTATSIAGAHVVSGGSRTESRGILATKREIRDLRERVGGGGGGAVGASADEMSRLRARDRGGRAPRCRRSVGRRHRQEKAIVSARPTWPRATADEARVRQRAELVATEARGARETIDGSTPARPTRRRRSAGSTDERGPLEAALADAQRRLADARERARRAQPDGRRGARRCTPALVERALAAAAEVERLEEAARELSERADACRARHASSCASSATRLLDGIGRGPAR